MGVIDNRLHEFLFCIELFIDFVCIDSRLHQIWFQLLAGPFASFGLNT
jgi:hypothetical protein